MADILTPTRLHAGEHSSPPYMLSSSPLGAKKQKRHSEIDELRQLLEDHKLDMRERVLRFTQERERAELKIRLSLKQQSLQARQELEAALAPIREDILSLKRHYAAKDLGKFLTVAHAKNEGVFEEIMKDATERAKEAKIGMDLGKGGFLKHVKMALLDVTSPMLAILKDAFEAHPAFKGDGVWDGYVDAVTASLTPVDIGMSPANAFANRFAGSRIPH